MADAVSESVQLVEYGGLALLAFLAFRALSGPAQAIGGAYNNIASGVGQVASATGTAAQNANQFASPFGPSEVQTIQTYTPVDTGSPVGDFFSNFGAGFGGGLCILGHGPGC